MSSRMDFSGRSQDCTKILLTLSPWVYGLSPTKGIVARLQCLLFYGFDETNISVIPLQVQGSGQWSAIAVPSRLCVRDPRKSPLQGVRITVKEIFSVKGLKTGLGSRAYSELYPPATATSPAIQKLLDAGAEVLGVSKMCPMVLKAPPTQCVDVSAPFNPRGDGYHSPSGGSSGQAAAVATYPWLDFAIASDCRYAWAHCHSGCVSDCKFPATFSGRMPAQANGCFSLRPTHGALSVEGMWSGVPYGASYSNEESI